jgi:anti-sigma factor RsiW
MSCDQTSQVQAYYDGELSPDHRQTVAEHFPTCAECARLLADLEELSKAIVSAPRASMSADARRRLEQAWWAARDRGVLHLAEWLTAAAAAVLVGALMFWSDGERATPAPQQAMAWQTDALMPPAESRDEVASNVVDLAEWMANDLSADSNR